jgi:ubiquinol-cytochrome c reductase cytochrome c1 subunit
MIRVLGILIGLGFVIVTAWSLGNGVYGAITSPAEKSVESRFHLEAKALHLASDGPFGKYDRQQLQRGYQVYSEVCSACHSMSYIAFRNLAELGYNEAEIKALADKKQVPDLDPKTGDPTTRKAIPADHFPSPYPNEIAARGANNNALPPDLSLITKAREGGAAYIYSLLTGYQDQANYRNEAGEALPAENRTLPPGLHFNPYFANLNIAMPPPLTSAGQVTYADGTNPTVDQMAKDVAAFLTWTAEPRLENRHRTGLVVVLFLLFATVLAYMAYQNIWHGPTSRRVRRTGVLDPENMAKRDAASAEGLDH